MSTARSQLEDVGPPGLLRVILVGRCPLEASLRRDARLELVRAKSVIEAIGELHDPIDAFSPVRSVVVVSPDAEPTGAGLSASALKRALCEVEQGVTLMRVQAGGETPSGYDAIVAGDATVEGFLRAAGVRLEAASRAQGVHARGPAPAVQPVQPVTTDVEPNNVRRAPQDAASGLPGQHTAVVTLLDAERVMAHAIGEGREVASAGVIALRSLLGEDVHVTRGESSTGSPGVPGAVAITAEGKHFGWLSSQSLDQGTLASAAAWLGAWMALQQQQHELRRLSTTDELTGAYNRRYFERYCHHAAEHGRKTRSGFSILLLDVDNFKYFNDKFGHAAGDEILSELVKLLTATTRPHDRVCRIGGDELVVVLFDPEGPRERGSQPLASAWQIARRFQERVYDHRFSKLGEAPARLTVSGGLASFPWDGLQPADLLRAADERLLEAKRQGKDRIIMGREG